MFVCVCVVLGECDRCVACSQSSHPAEFIFIQFDIAEKKTPGSFHSTSYHPKYLTLSY